MTLPRFILVRLPLRHLALLAGAMAIVSLPPSVSAVQPGDARTDVLAEFGQPTGSIRRSATEILFYPEGEIQLRDGVVANVRLLTPEAMADQQAAEARAKAARAERVAALAAAGRELREQKLSDPVFAEWSAREQLAFWQAFAARYPMVPVESEIAALRERAWQEELAERQREFEEQRIAELEARVAAAEARAARAEREARRARNDGGFFPWFSFSGRHDHHRHPDKRHPADRTPRATPPGNSADAARARAMGDYEAARRDIYSRSLPQR